MTSYKLINTSYSWNDISLLDFINDNQLPKNWEEFFNNIEIIKILFQISESIDTKYTIYPDLNQVFRAFYMTSFNDVKVVLLGQDCYHNGNATGLCFDVKKGGSLNPSLRNIYKELELEGFNPTKNGDLSHLPSQGVLLINASLSVIKSDADSHTEYWFSFTKELVNL